MQGRGGCQSWKVPQAVHELDGVGQQIGARDVQQATVDSGWLNTGNIVPAYQLHERRFLHRKNGDCPSTPCPVASQLNFSLYVSGASQVAISLLEPRVTVCKQVSLCTDPLSGHLDF